MQLFKRQLILPFLLHKSATMGHIDSNKVSNYKLKLCKWLKRRDLQLLHRSNTSGLNFLGHPVETGTLNAYEILKFSVVRAYVFTVPLCVIP